MLGNFPLVADNFSEVADNLRQVFGNHWEVVHNRWQVVGHIFVVVENFRLVADNPRVVEGHFSPQGANSRVVVKKAPVPASSVLTNRGCAQRLAVFPARRRSGKPRGSADVLPCEVAFPLQNRHTQSARARWSFVPTNPPQFTMKSIRVLTRSIATLAALAPLVSYAAQQTIAAAGDPTVNASIAAVRWGTDANWSGPNGALKPAATDNAVITYGGSAAALIDIRGSGLGGATTIEDLSFAGAGTGAVTLENNSTSTGMVLTLNGGRGAGVPLLQTGTYAVTIPSVGPGTVQTLTLQLAASGDINVAAGGLNFGAAIGETGGAQGFNKTGPGTLTFTGGAANLFSGTTTVSTGLLVAGKTAGVTAIPGNLVIVSGGTFLLGASDQIANTSSVSINGGTFGDLSTIAGPAMGGPIDTVANVTLNGGTFLSNRNLTGFTATGLFKVTSGTALAQRGGVINAGSVEISGGSVNLDGGSGTPANESRLNVGAGGLTLTSGTINFNAGPSTLGVTSVGSIVGLAGNVASTGTSSFVRLNPGIVGPKAVVDLGGAARTFNVEGTLDMGSNAAQIAIDNGSLVKTGGGTLNFNSVNTYPGATTVNGGTLSANKTGAGNAIAGDLIIGAGGTFRLGASDQIADTASVTINGGTFGDAASIANPPNPGPIDTVAALTVNSGSFLSNRNLTGFTVTNLLRVTGGMALAQRGGGINAGGVDLSGTGAINLDGGSTTPGNESRLKIGAGGLTMAGTTINFNAGPSTVNAGSTGSILTLNGNVTTTGTSALARLNPTVSNALVDLAAGVRTFNVTGTLTVTPDVGAATDLAAAGIVKTGTGTLVLEGVQHYASLFNGEGRTDVLKTIGTGTSTVTVSAGEVNLAVDQTFTSIDIADGAIVSVGLPFPPPAPPFAAAVPEPGSVSLLLAGALSMLRRRRRNG